VSKSTNTYQKLRREHEPGKKSKKDGTLELQKLIEAGTSTSWSNTKRLSAWINTTWDWPRTSHIESISRITSQFSANSSTYLKHTQFIEQSLDEWLKLGVVRQSNSSYNSPIFCVPKKQGQGLRIVQDLRLLNQHSYIDKYSIPSRGQFHWITSPMGLLGCPASF